MHIEAIFISGAAGEPMESRGAIEAVRGGLRDDRYL